MHWQRAKSIAPWVLRDSPWDPFFFGCWIYQIKEIDIFLFGDTVLSGFPLTIRRAHVWRCVECQYPKCKLCDARPEMPVSHNHMEADGSWYCLMHRYPPCHICRITPRPASTMHGSKRRFADWTCPECKANESSCADDRSSKPVSSAQASAVSLTALGNTTQCQDTKPAANEDRKEVQSLSRIIHGNRSNQTFPCKECGVVRPFTDFFRDPKNRNRAARCDFCMFPSCAFCGQKGDTDVPVWKKKTEG